MISKNPKHVIGFLLGTIFLLAGLAYQNCGQVEETSIESSIDENSINQLNATVTIQGVTTGYHHSCALRSNGSIKCWGQNNYGQLGNGTTTDSSLPVIANISGVKSIDGGSNFTCAAMLDGTVKCWGQNSSGQLGNGTTTDSLTPVVAVGINNAVSVVAGVMHACALLADGSIKCWGDNFYGGLGSNVPSSSVPILVPGINNATAVSVENGSCALLSTDQIKCWGDNDYGQLGNGSTVDSLAPVTVNGINNAVAIAVGSAHACARLSDNTVKCWGDDSQGAIGNGDPMSGAFSTPVLVPNLTGVSKITAGAQHTCIINAAGQGKCWGFGQQGQNGNGGSLSVSAPVVVQNLIKPSLIDNDYFHVCSLINGGVKCWGRNQYGQLGNGTTINSNIPVIVQNL